MKEIECITKKVAKMQKDVDSAQSLIKASSQQSQERLGKGQSSVGRSIVFRTVNLPNRAKSRWSMKDLANSEISEVVHELQMTNTSLHDGTFFEEALDTAKLSLDRSESHVMRLTASLSGSAGNGGILAGFQRFSGF